MRCKKNIMVPENMASQEGWLLVRGLLVRGFTVIYYDDVKMDAMASQITSLTIVYSNVYSGADQSKHQSSASLAFVQGIHRGPGNSPHKWPVTRKMFPFDDVIMIDCDWNWQNLSEFSYVFSFGTCENKQVELFFLSCRSQRCTGIPGSRGHA